MTQSEFAKLIGVSLIAVKKIECGTLPLSPKLAYRIYLQTGAGSYSLQNGDGKVSSGVGVKPYTRPYWDWWRQRIAPSNEAQAIKTFDETTCPHMLLLLLAAACPAIGGKVKDRLGGLVNSWREWEEDAIEKFGLRPQLMEILQKLHKEQPLSMTWGEWRERLKRDRQIVADMKAKSPGSPICFATCEELFGFKDNPRKKAGEMLALTSKTKPRFDSGIGYTVESNMVQKIKTLFK